MVQRSVVDSPAGHGGPRERPASKPPCSLSDFPNISAAVFIYDSYTTPTLKKKNTCSVCRPHANWQKNISLEITAFPSTHCCFKESGVSLNSSSGNHSCLVCFGLIVCESNV